MTRIPTVLCLAFVAALAAPAHAQDPCSTFKWDVSLEHALFGGKPLLLHAGSDGASATPIQTDTLYEATLSPQDKVQFAVPPGKRMLTDGAFAGIAAFTVREAGSYRVSLDAPFWIDIVAGGKLVATRDFGGAPACNAPHKVVEYDLPAGEPLLLQFSGATSPAVRFTVTRSSATRH